MRIPTRQLLFASMIGLGMAGPVHAATIIDLTTAGTSVTFGGAIFQQVDPSSTGTGLIDSFSQIGDGSPNTGSVVEGYNTTVNNTFDNGAPDNFNHAILLTEIPVVNIGGTNYLEFILDINQNNSDAGGNFFSLDEIQIFQSNTQNPGVESFTNCVVDLGTLVYRLDSGCGGTLDDNYVKHDYANNNGSGSGDMLLYVRQSLFSNSLTYVYLYSRFGENYANNDGFEEWALRDGTGGGTDSETPVPEPGSLLLLGSGLVIAARRLKKRQVVQG